MTSPGGGALVARGGASIKRMKWSLELSLGSSRCCITSDRVHIVNTHRWPASLCFSTGTAATGRARTETSCIRWGTRINRSRTPACRRQTAIWWRRWPPQLLLEPLKHRTETAVQSYNNNNVVIALFLNENVIFQCYLHDFVQKIKFFWD